MYNQPMYFFKSIETASDHKLEDGQVVIKNVSNRILRCATPPFMVQPNGFAVVSAKDPMFQTRLTQGLVVEMTAAVATNVASVDGKVGKKSQKKNVEEVVVEEIVVEETVVEAIAVEATSEEITAKREPKEVQY